jgi:hypothetical protein
MKIAIIGGGAAGMMAAVAALQSSTDAEVILLEKNRSLGKKVLITGGGRCNVTTGLDDVKEVLKNYPRGQKFLSSAFFRFPPKEIRIFFQTNEIPLKTEADNRVFPESEDGRDIVHVFERLLQNPRAQVKTGAIVERVEKDGKLFHLHLKNGARPLTADRVIIATGGRAYRETGSTGDGYQFAKALGHRITQLNPSLGSLTLKERWPRSLTGMAFERAEISVARQRNVKHVGAFLFTHRGITGPAVFAFSALLANKKFSPNKPLEISIDLFPDEPSEITLAHFLAETENHRRRSFRNVLAEFMPKKMADAACAQLGIRPEIKSAEMGKKDLRRAASWLNAIPLHVTGRTAGSEFVTAGGVRRDQINPSTMESKLVPGLFFCGEVLDVDGFTGGVNLTAAWATGHLAGSNAVR